MKRNESEATYEVKGMKKKCWRRTDEEEQICTDKEEWMKMKE